MNGVLYQKLVGAEKPVSKRADLAMKSKQLSISHPVKKIYYKQTGISNLFPTFAVPKFV